MKYRKSGGGCFLRDGYHKTQRFTVVGQARQSHSRMVARAG